MKSPSFIRTDDHLTIVFEDGISVTAYASDSKYVELVKAFRDKDYERVKLLAVPAEKLKQDLNASPMKTSRVTVEHGVVYLDKKELHNSITTRIIQMLREGFDILPMSLFLENLMNNPSYRAVNELYVFLEKGNLPITEDGHFLAYKRVRADYKDCHSGTFDNSVGNTLEMPRNQVDEDKNRTCSAGLHFCSRSYLGSYNSGTSGFRTIILKINPADVVAIPADYNDAKGRTCKYTVIGELTSGQEAPLEGLVDTTYSRPASVVNLRSDEDDEFEEDDRSTEDSDELVDTTPRAFAATPEGSVVKTNIDNTVQQSYPSLKNASEATGVSVSDIRRVCNGGRKTAGGYIWIWA